MVQYVVLFHILHMINVSDLDCVDYFSDYGLYSDESSPLEMQSS